MPRLSLFLADPRGAQTTSHMGNNMASQSFASAAIFSLYKTEDLDDCSKGKYGENKAYSWYLVAN